ncbi:hypothetical protein [Nocardia ninae]|nr:hypothetical protein [Nocardia ninae]
MSSLQEIDQKKRLCAGVGLRSAAEDTWLVDSSTEAEFRKVVSSYYKLWKETLADDIAFLKDKHDRHPAVDLFTTLILNIRTANEHTNAISAIEVRDRWVRLVTDGVAESQWAVCGVALAESLAKALAELSEIASDIVTSAELRAEWRARESVSVPAVVTNVASDLGLKFPKNELDRRIRVVTTLWTREVRSDGRPPIERLESLAERELVNTFVSLPCSFRDILEELSIGGSLDAAPALRLAHSVNEIAELPGNAFVGLVAKVWTDLVDVRGSTR